MSDIAGTVIPLPTPFDERGEVDENTLRKIIDFELNAHVDEIMVAGSYGQGPVMRSDQRMRVAEIAVNEVQRQNWACWPAEKLGRQEAGKLLCSWCFALRSLDSPLDALRIPADG
jgi:hypothetical protein